jgi:hypothetical protein
MFQKLERTPYMAAMAFAGTFLFPVLAEAKAIRAGALTVAPYAAVSSTKAIAPDKVKMSSDGESESSATETVTQRVTYGLKLDLRLGRLFVFSANGGVNKMDQSKKSVAMRDEYGDIDFAKDANVDMSNSDATYRYKEEQRVGNVQLTIAPQLVKRLLWVKVGAGVRARQRLISITDELAGTSKSITDPIRYSPAAVAGVGTNLLGAISASIEYKFYFPKFPKTEPHEQEVLMSVGMSI